MTHREPTKEEKKVIIVQHTRDGKVRCYVNDHPIENEKDIEFHHSKPFSEEGKTEISNLAPVCKDHHRRIRTLSITEFRTRLEMEEFFKSPEPRRLDDVLKKKISDEKFGKVLINEISDRTIKLFLEDRSDPIVLSLYKCPSTSYKYFYITLPVKYIQNDIELQPRPIEMRRLWELYRHMLTHTQLSPAICRLKDNKILLFDGQHKVYATVTNNHGEIEESSGAYSFVKSGEKVLRLFEGAEVGAIAAAENLQKSFIFLMVAMVVLALGVAFFVIGLLQRKKSKLT